MRTIFATVLAAIGWVGTAQAAEKIRYEEIPERIGPFGSSIRSRAITVTTLEGTRHKGTEIFLRMDGLDLGGMFGSPGLIPSAQIARIEISPRGRSLHHTTDLLSFVTAICGLADVQPAPGCVTASVIIFSPVLAFGVASAPFTLLGEALALVLPAQDLEIVH